VSECNSRPKSSCIVSCLVKRRALKKLGDIAELHLSSHESWWIRNWIITTLSVCLSVCLSDEKCLVYYTGSRCSVIQ